MVATAILINRGRPTKLAPSDDADIVLEPSIVQVGNQSAEGLIQQRQVIAGVAEIVAVIIPEAVGHGDEPGSGFNQSASH